MGLGDILDDDNENSTSPSTSSSGRDFVHITKEEFEEFLDSLPGNFVEVNDPSVGEYVYRAIVTSVPESGIQIRVASTVSKETGKTRKKGSDAIRNYLYHEPTSTVIGGRKKTLRIESWKSNLAPKIESLHDEASEYIISCPGCQTGMLVEREGEYGPFHGCSNYPDCTAMASETVNGNWKARPDEDTPFVYGDTMEEVLSKVSE